MSKLTKGSYPSDWVEIAQVIREKAGWKCQNCGHPDDPGHGYMLTVHHIDLNPSNNKPRNLVALCQRCHLYYQHPINLYQLSMFNQPLWLKPFFDALGLNSSVPPTF